MPVVHCKKEDHDIYIGRPSKWGNPYSHQKGTQAKFKVDTRQQAIEAYKTYLWKLISAGKISLVQLAELDNKTLGCWCAPKPCHGDVLLAAANWAKEQLKQQSEN
jgi:hypothetical protein